jgi:hypothetical protein
MGAAISRVLGFDGVLSKRGKQILNHLISRSAGSLWVTRIGRCKAQSDRCYGVFRRRTICRLRAGEGV